MALTNNRTLRGSLVSAAWMVVLATTASASASELRMINSWDPSYVGSKEISERFIAGVREASGGNTVITTMGPETVPPFEQLQPVTAGVFDMLFTHGAYHFGDTGIGMAMDAVVGTPQQVRDSGLWKMVDEHYNQRGLKLVSLPTMPSGYHIILREPIGPDGGLAGRTIRATPVYHGLLDRLGASPVVLPGGEIYSALERGVVDGAAWPSIGALDFRWNEVSDHFLRPTFGSVAHLIFMNMDKWESLPPEEQSLLLAEGQDLEIEVYERFNELARTEKQALEAAGMSETSLSPENVAELPAQWANGVWSVVGEKDGEKAQQARNLALEAGLTK